MEDKARVGQAAATLVEDHTTVGIGSGSTAQYFIKALAERVKTENLTLTLVATSEESQQLAESLGMPVSSLATVDYIDLTIDGVDEFTDDNDGIKGGGGCLLEEKIVAINSNRVIWLAEERKHVDTLGQFPLPVEVIKNGSEQLKQRFEVAGYKPTWRMVDDASERFRTDNDNYILDLHLETIDQPHELAESLIREVGVVETGLFLGITDRVLLAHDGQVYWNDGEPFSDN